MRVAPVLITFTNKQEELARLAKSIESYGWNMEVLLIDGEYPGANAKFKAILGASDRLRARGYSHLISVDGFDTVVMGNMQSFLGKLHDYNYPALILAAETNLYPDKTRRLEYPNPGTRWKFVNSPFILDLMAPIPEGFAEIGDLDDQLHMCNWYLDFGQKDQSVVLDSRCDFFQTLFGINKSLFASDYQNKETGTYPLFFHGNGHADMSWLPFHTGFEQARVLIGIPSAGYQRHGQFLDFITTLTKPPGTQFAFVHGQSPAQARNIVIRRALAEGYTHVFFVDDDILLPNDALTKMLNMDVDMATGLYLIRKWPHQPIIFIDDGHMDKKVRWRCLEPEDEGVIEIDNAGLGCSLIRTKVFAAMQDPWITLGNPDPEGWCDDVAFFMKAKKAGFRLWCDTTIRCGHCAQLIVWPHYQLGKWHTILDTQGVKALNIAQLTFKEFQEQCDEQQQEAIAARAL